MANPIVIPSNSMILPVNLSSSFKTLTLPVVSTNPGRFLIFKDVYGNAGTSSLRLSTTGLDTIERANLSSISLSNPYGAWWFTNDGISRWFLTDAYFNNLFFVPQASGFLSGLWAKFYTFSGSTPNSNGPSSTSGGNGWGTPITGTFTGTQWNGSNTPGTTNFIWYGNSCNNAVPQANTNYSGIYSGFIYSATAGTIQFQIVTDDGMRVDFNGSNAIISWQGQAPTTYTSAVLTLPAGYTPILMRWYDGGGGGASVMSYNINGAGYTSNGTGVYYYLPSNITQL